MQASPPKKRTRCKRAGSPAWLGGCEPLRLGSSDASGSGSESEPFTYVGLARRTLRLCQTCGRWPSVLDVPACHDCGILSIAALRGSMRKAIFLDVLLQYFVKVLRVIIWLTPDMPAKAEAMANPQLYDTLKILDQVTIHTFYLKKRKDE